MRSSVEREIYKQTGSEWGPELIPEPPPLLKGIGRVFVATEKPQKLQAVKDLLDQYPVLVGTDFVVPEPYKLTGTEPPWDNAVLVSRDKVENVVSRLKGEFGPKTAVFASDIVIWFNGIPYQNLSRIPNLSEAQLNKEVQHLQEVFSEETEVMWDVATSVSRPDLRLTLADRHIARFRPIDSGRIATAFWEDMPGVLKRNSRIQLLEKFPEYVLELGTVPFIHIAERDGVFLQGYEWAREVRHRSPDRQQDIRDVLAQVVGGLPVNGRINDLLNVRPLPNNSRGWMLI